MVRALVLLVALLVPGVARAQTADPGVDEAAARAVVTAWLAAQNDGSFTAYSALYARDFVGIRRTSDGGEKRMKRKAWLADRKKMFKRKQQVAADSLTVTVKDGTAIARFVQRWKGGGYADHGVKVLRLAPDKAGTLQITREELLSSTPGWEADPGKVLDATALASPITVTMKGVGILEEDGCQSVTWVVYLKDKKKRVVQKEVGLGVLMIDTSSDDVRSTIDVAPEGDKGTLFAVGEWCAGGADHYTITKSGDALIVNYRGVGECPHDEPDCDPETRDTVLTIQLPEGAKVRAK